MKQLKYTLIKNLDQYNEYCETLETLVFQDYDTNLEEIELLTLLIEHYDEQQMEVYDMDLNPVELLSSLLSENNLSEFEAAKRLGISAQLLNDVLKYRKEISKSVAHKIANEFKMNFSAFLRPYLLKKAS